MGLHRQGGAVLRGDEAGVFAEGAGPLVQPGRAGRVDAQAKTVGEVAGAEGLVDGDTGLMKPRGEELELFEQRVDGGLLGVASAGSLDVAAIDADGEEDLVAGGEGSGVGDHVEVGGEALADGGVVVVFAHERQVRFEGGGGGPFGPA